VRDAVSGNSRGFDSPLAQFLQFIEAGGASSYVLEQMRELSVRWGVRKLRQYFAAWTAEALRIRKIPVHDVVECVYQIFFRVHKRAIESKQPPAESHDPESVSMKICVCIPFAKHRCGSASFSYESRSHILHLQEVSCGVRHIPVSPPCID
jgi:hypothetical protein